MGSLVIPTEGTPPNDPRRHGSLYQEMFPVIGYQGYFKEFEFQKKQYMGRPNALG